MPLTDGVLFDPSVGDMVGFGVVGHRHQFVTAALDEIPLNFLIFVEGCNERRFGIGEADGLDFFAAGHGLRPSRGFTAPCGLWSAPAMCHRLRLLSF